MVKTEFYMERSDGVRLIRNYSDVGKYITRDGVIYEEAIDPEDTNRQYEETDEYIPVEELSSEEALSIITGGEI